MEINIDKINKWQKETKSKFPNAICLFRVGDFYNIFNEDAVICSEILGITLGRRDTENGRIEFAGFPHHLLETFWPPLVRAGYCVAICEQLYDPKIKELKY